MSRNLLEIFVEDIEDVEIEHAPELPEAPLVPTPGLVPLDQLDVCPRCMKPLFPALAMSGNESTCFLECKECGTLVNTFRPLPHQAEFQRHPARYKLAGGGYGSGKSMNDIQYVIKHLLLIPRARVGVCGRSYPALNTTFSKDFFEAFPDKLIRRKNEKDHEYTLTNGSTLILRSFDDPTKLKSMNLTLAVIVEASDVPESGFTMMQSRIRNKAAMIPEYDLNGRPITYWDAKSQTTKIKYAVDARHILMETNPASNWVKNFLLDSKYVSYYGSAQDEGYKFSERPDKYKYTQIISTDANPYLPEDYEDEMSKGKSAAWVRQFLKGSFNFNTNLVFPNFGLCIVKPHELPREFDEYGRRRLYYLIGLDYGIVDPTHIVYAAFSLDTKKLYVYDELRITNADVRTIAKEYRKNTRINGTNLEGLLMQPRFDGRSYNKRESDLHTIGGAFEACGLYFEPSFANHEIRIIKLNSLINHSQIEVFSTCEFLIEEMLNYTFILDKEGRPTKTPKDGKDHGISALEFIVVELPHNLQEVKTSAYLPTGVKIVHDTYLTVTPTKPKQKLYNPLEDNKNDTYNFGIVPDTMYNDNRSDLIYSNISGVYGEEDEDDARPLGAYIPYR